VTHDEHLGRFGDVGFWQGSFGPGCEMMEKKDSGECGVYVAEQKIDLSLP
jgi:hypothetical protein